MIKIAFLWRICTRCWNEGRFNGCSKYKWRIFLQKNSGQYIQIQTWCFIGFFSIIFSTECKWRLIFKIAFFWRIWARSYEKWQSFFKFILENPDKVFSSTHCILLITWCLIWLFIFASSAKRKRWLTREIAFFGFVLIWRILIWCWGVASDFVLRSRTKCEGFCLINSTICNCIRARTRCCWHPLKHISITQRVDWFFWC